MRAGVIVGHNERQPGHDALGAAIKPEFFCNSEIAEEMARICGEENNGLEILIFHRIYLGSYSREIPEVYGKVDAAQVDVSSELHYNAYNRTSTGTETLSSGSTKSVALAAANQQVMVQTLGLRDRGVKVRNRYERGGLSLHIGRAPAMLPEPFFGSNPHDVAAAEKLGNRGFARMYVQALLLYGQQAGLLHSTPGVPIHRPVEPPKTPLETRLAFEGPVTKEQWLKNNRRSIEGIVDTVNDWLTKREGSRDINPVSTADFYLLFNSEAAVTSGGGINTGAVHSNGEKGLLPLPSNLSYWTGVTNEWDVSTPQGNVMAFAHYLGALKNSNVGRQTGRGLSLYGGLFGHGADAIAEARTLAAVVHGYFYPQNFNLQFPNDLLLAAVESGNPSAALTELGYKHPASVVDNRMKNLEAAAAWV